MNYCTSISKEAVKKINLSLKLKGKVVGEVCQIELQHEIFKLESHRDDGEITLYDVHVKKEPSCTCPDFVEREAKGKPYLACKHLYFIFLCVLGLSQIENMFIHQPILSELDLYKALSHTRSYPNLV